MDQLFEVLKGFGTTTRRFKSGDRNLAAADLAGAMPLDDLVDGGFVRVMSASPAPESADAFDQDVA